MILLRATCSDASLSASSSRFFDSMMAAYDVDDGRGRKKGRKRNQLRAGPVGATAFFPFSRHWPPPRSDRGKLVDRKAPFWKRSSAFLSPFSAGTLNDDFCCQKLSLTKSTEWLGALVGGAAIAARDDDDGERRRRRASGWAAPARPWICAPAEARREAVAGRAPIADEARRAKAMALRRRRGEGGRKGKRKKKKKKKRFFSLRGCESEQREAKKGE